MKIACCLFRYFPFGGLGRDYKKIATELVRRGHQVVTYVYQWDAPPPEPSLGLQKIICSSVTNHGRMREFYTKLKVELQKDPVNIVLGFNKMPGLDYYFAADICYKEYVNTSKRGINKFCYKLTSRYKTLSEFEEAVFGEDSKTVVMFLDSNQKKLYDKHYKIEPNRVVILPPGVDPDDFKGYTKEHKEQLRRSLGLKPQDFLIIQVGSDFKRKGVDRSLRAIAALPEELKERVLFKVIGKDDSVPFEKLADSLGIRNRIIFSGGQPSVVIDLLSADLLLHPAYSENTGTVIAESIIAGTPEIVTANCGFAHLVEEANAGVVLQEPFRQEEMNHALESTLLSLGKIRSNIESYKNKRKYYSIKQKAVEVILE